jgi:hypothetical protein
LGEANGGFLQLKLGVLIPVLALVVPFCANAASFSTYFDLALLGDTYVVGSQSDLNNVQLHGRFKLSNETEKNKMYLDLGAGGLAGEKTENYFILPQAFVTRKFSEGAKVTIGRRVMTWSAMDDYWQLGDVQPLFRWDAARPEVQGITGVVVELKPTDYFQIDVFGSPLFIPTQGPSFSASEGKLTSGNPWFSPPVDNLNVSGQPYDLIFSVKTPDVSDIVFKPNWGISTTLKTPNEEFLVRAGYFSKQRNDLALPFEATLNLSNYTADVTVHPRTAEHRLATLDLAYKGQTWGFIVSGLRESDVKFDVEEPNWIYPAFSDQYKVAAMLNMQLSAFHTFEIGGLRTFDNEIAVQGLGTGFKLDIYSFRNQYDNTVDLRLSSVFAPRPHGFLFQTKLRYAYDYKVETSLVSADLNYNPLAYLTCFARMDLFGGARDVSDTYNNLLVNYLDNDRFQIGVKYVF